MAKKKRKKTKSVPPKMVKNAPRYIEKTSKPKYSDLVILIVVLLILSALYYYYISSGYYPKTEFYIPRGRPF